MKNKIIVVVLLSLSVFMFNACKKNTTEPSSGVSGNYFPNGDGTHYKFNVEYTDSVGNLHQGTRSTSYSGTSNYGGAVFQKQIDSLSMSGVTTSFVTLFQKANNEVNYAIDTTGLSNTIPDSLMQYIKLDANLKLLKFPFQDGMTWPVFKVDFQISSFTLTIIKVTAAYKGMEQIPLNLASGTVTKNAAKVEYDFQLTIPDAANPLAPAPTTTFTADAWLVDNIGIVKWQGNGAIIGAFTGSSINFADTTSVVTQSLVSYSIK